MFEITVIRDGAVPLCTADSHRTMPEITYNGETVECTSERSLLRALPRGTISAPGPLKLCQNGTCGMCTVTVEGAVDEPTDIERSRLSGQWDDGDRSLRLACQTTVLGDVEVILSDDE